MKRFVQLFLSLALGIAISGNNLLPAQSAAASGGVSGTVTDKAGGILPGAQVILMPGNRSAVTDSQGQFVLTNLAPGQYTITTNMLGFTSATTTVTIQPSQMLTDTIAMSVASVSQNVTVYAGRAYGEVAALNQQQNANNILEVLPSSVIASLPNTNIADAVGRLPGVSLERDEGEGKYVQIRGTEPRLSNTTIDGINVPAPESAVRNVKLDVIPAALVEQLEVSKTLTSNQDGDAIGGTVNLVTRTASDEPYFTVTAMGGRTPIEQGGRNLSQITAAGSNRFGAHHQLGVFAGGSYDYNGRGIDDVEPGTAVNTAADGSVFAAPNTMDLREYYYHRSRYGFAGTVDYRVSPTTTVFARSFFSDFRDFGGKYIYTPTAGNFITAGVADNTGTMSYADAPRSPDYQIFTFSTNAKHVASKWVFDATAAVSRSRADNQNFPQADFNGPQNVAFNVDTSNTNRPKFIVTNGVPIHDPTTYGLADISFTHDHSAQINLQGGLDVSRIYQLGTHSGTFQAGFKVRNAHKFNEANDKYYNSDGTILLSTVLDPSFTNSDYYSGTYGAYGPVSSWDKLVAAFNSNPGKFTENIASESSRSLPNNWNTHELIPAFYAMDTIDIGRFRLIGGLRVEVTDSNFTGLQVAQGSLTATPTKGSSTYVDFMPNAQMQYNLSSNQDIRVVYGRGIARPNYGDLPPYILINGTRNQINLGNPNLVPTRANNFDVLYERYTKTVGALTAGFFYKSLSNPIVTVQTPYTQAPYAGYTAVQPQNLPNAYLGGLELGWQEHFRNLPGPLSGLGLLANYAYSFSQAKQPYCCTDASGNPAVRTVALDRQAPNTFNVAPTFDTKRLSVRLGVTYNQTSIYSYNYSGLVNDPSLYGPKGPGGDVYLYGHLQIDSQISYNLPGEFQLTASGLNLSNEAFGFYQGSEAYPIQREYYHPSYTLSLKWTSKGDKN
ncbi:MAG: TonB-dependent receptor [Acidobacteriota bacterium]|nr:TonB-dependent receptor [Acidobacteriota bacterium]